MAKVALYHPWIYLKGGIERTLIELVTRSRHDWTLFTNVYLADDTFPQFRDLNVVQLAPVSVRRRLSTVAAACLKVLLSRPRWRDFDALVVSCDGIGNLATFRAGGMPLICLCHTPLKIAYDSATRARWLSLQRPGLPTRAGVSLFTFVDRLAWSRYDRIVCVSREVESRLLQAGAARPEQLQVAYPGVDTQAMAPSGRRENFLLLPGRIMWTKNLELGIRAFLALKERGGDTRLEWARLVVAGMVDAKSESYLQSLQALAGSRSDIEFVVSPSDSTLFDLYDRCYAVLFAAPNEDWGIVPLEAMAFGKPVVAVNRGGPAESIIDGETGFLCPPRPSDFADALGRLFGDEELYRRMSVAARARAALFSWPRFLEQIDGCVDQLVQPRPGLVPAGR